MNNSQEKEELGHKYSCLTMNNSISNNTQELSKKEKILAANAAYKKANREKIKAYNKSYQEANKEELRARQKVYEKANKEKRTAQHKAWREANKEKNRSYNKAYREANKEKLSAQEKSYREATKERKSLYLKAYNQINKEKHNAQARARHIKRVKSDPLYHTKVKLRSAVRTAFKRIGQNKPADTLTLLGCTWEEAKAHFESLFREGMSWENHGSWHIDHIRPVASFGPDELDQMNHISNLQPLWADENQTKGSRCI